MRHRLPERPNQRQEAAHHRDDAPLQASRRADADQLTHEEPEIEGARVEQHALQNVRVPAEVHAAHPAGLIEMGKGSFHALPATSQQPLAARATDASTIAVDGVAGRRVLLPIASPTIGFRDVAAHAYRLEIDERLVTVIALVADDFFDAVAVGLHRFDLL